MFSNTYFQGELELFSIRRHCWQGRPFFDEPNDGKLSVGRDEHWDLVQAVFLIFDASSIHASPNIRFEASRRRQTTRTTNPGRWNGCKRSLLPPGLVRDAIVKSTSATVE